MYQLVVKPKASVAGRTGPTRVRWRPPVDAAPRRAPDQTALDASGLRRGHDYSAIRVHGEPPEPATPKPVWATAIQRRPMVSSPVDWSERQADRVADDLLAGRPLSMESLSPAANPGPVSGRPLAEDRIQQVQAQLSGGEPLPGKLRAGFEHAFGIDFGAVRVHEGPRAAQAAAALRARGFTSGPHVVFGAGQYAPGTRAGLHLLAHELAHVAQQRTAGQGKIVQRQPAAHATGKGTTTSGATAPSTAENPTYRDAKEYLERYFRRRGELENLLAEIRDTAFRSFQEVTSEAFNAESHVGLQLLLIALTAIPEAGALVTAFKKLTTGTKLSIRLEHAAETVKRVKETVEPAVEKLKEGLEPIKAVGKPVLEGRETLQKAKEVEEKREGASETIEGLQSLADLRVEETGKRWDDEDAALEELGRHKNDGPSVDLLAQTRRQLEQQSGPLPKGGEHLKKVAAEVEKKFELELLRDHYTKEGAYWDHRSQSGFIYQYDNIANIPHRALDYIKALGKYADNGQLAKAWHLREDDSIEPPYGP